MTNSVFSRILDKMPDIIKLKVEDITLDWVKELKSKYPDFDLEIRLLPSEGKAPFTEEEFWKIIDLLDWSGENSDQQILQPAVDFLAALPVSHIYLFEDILSKYLYHLDTKAHASALGEYAYSSGTRFSVDHFLYARACVIANGKSVYEKILSNPSEMPKEQTFEPLVHLAAKAYLQKKGTPFDYMPEYNYETFSNQSGWPS